MKFILSVFTLFIFLISCNSNDVVFPVNVKIIHNQTDPASLNSDFNFNSDSFLLITLFEKRANEEDSVIYHSRIDSINNLPFEFTLNPDLPEKSYGGYLLQAMIFSEKHNVLFEGDLASQIPYTLNNNNGFLEIEVVGLELCDEAFADAFCTNRIQKTESCPAVAGKTFKGPPVPLPCFGGEGCGYTGSVSFSTKNENASLHPVNSDAIALMSYTQETHGIKLYSSENQSNPIEFSYINNCQEIQSQLSGNVYRDSELSWKNTIH